MTGPIYRADSGIEMIIYIIAVIMWVIGNVMSNKRKKQGKPPLPPRPGESTAETELREFLETLAGKPAETVVESMPPKVTRAKEKKQPKPRVTMPVRPTYTPEPVAPINIEEFARELRDGAPSMASSFSTTLRSGGNLFKTAGQSMPSLRYALGSNRPPPTNPVIRQKTLNNPQQLREIMAGKIILGPPRAFDPYDGNGEYKSS